MKYDLHLYYIDKKLIREMHSVDDKVMSVSPQIHKDTRPFIGIIVVLDKKKYCIPLTSPNKSKFNKKSQIDFIKIQDSSVKDEHGAPKTIGILNINNMIPVDETIIKRIDLTLYETDSPDTLCRKRLMIDQLSWCRNNISVIQNRANKVYRLVTESPDQNRNLVRRCCNFQRLEAALDRYLTKHASLVSETTHSSLPSKPQETASQQKPQEPFYFGKKAILGHKPSSKQQKPESSRDKSKQSHRNNNNIE